ncbi:FAD-dependent monooxygenase [Schumannella soli]|uniref:FAD-dependent monooxygenase n=1 Tax=Schumannella soli TaxID=2590779 RepID=A0A506XXC2_9MICO|nr:FAD-dependent monooxygenase [Schumannella soli]TPW74070.1 FAD-dependent monooxygenase [Schumannella soli]
MKALIIGGGVAGPATALALARVGIDAEVLERRPAADADEGSYLTLAPNGLTALESLGALEPVLAAGFPTRANRMFGAHGRLLGELSLGIARPDGRVGLTLKRSRLATVLAEQAAAAGATISYGAVVEEMREQGPSADATGITVRLADGRELTADLAIGADGVRSRTRSWIDPGAPAARYVGLTNFGGITHDPELAASLPAESWHFTFGSGAFVGAHPSPDGDVVWFVNVPEPEIARDVRASTSEAEWRARLGRLVAGDAGPAARLIANGRLELAGDSTYDLPRVPRWSRGRAVLIGDAAHAPSPSAGQGASMALEDAVVLVRALRDARADTDPATLSAAFAAYASQRRRRVERIVATAARSSSTKIPGPVGRRIQEVMLGFLFRHVVTEHASAWMTGYDVGALTPLPRPRS